MALMIRFCLMFTLLIVIQCCINWTGSIFNYTEVRRWYDTSPLTWSMEVESTCGWMVRRMVGPEFNKLGVMYVSLKRNIFH
jgi:hypothetical protein